MPPMPPKPSTPSLARAASRTVAPLVVLALLGLGCALLPGSAAAAADGPTVRLSAAQAGKGGSITVKGTGWRPGALLTMLVCGQSEPGRGVVGGTDSCANEEGRAVTTGEDGAFRKRLPVAEPPVPCPCVVHVATVTGAKARADAAFTVAGHPVKPLAKGATGDRLSVLSGTRLEGASGLLTWFGAPPQRTLVLTVGNVGPAPVQDPVFRVGASHGVYAPRWEEQRWRGTLAPGEKARIELPVELPGGAHGDYLVSLRFGGEVLAEQPWDVGRPWGVTVFWLLLCVVVPAAVFRVGMVTVDRLRPLRRGASPGRRRRPAARPSRGRHGAGGRGPRAGLPWFTPDAGPRGPARDAEDSAGDAEIPVRDPEERATGLLGPRKTEREG
ncbi:hypothetical protein AB0I16_22320 [Streptomyces sp. NPDC050703]|uniref:hypothetical protein n=1 Tax=Streptomyces sp. NPDC050703 TaxID=3157218 RepID=UPI00344901D1